MGTKGFEELDVYRLSEDLADGIWQMVAQWKGLAKETTGRQLARAADSIGANIAEGTGRGTFKDNANFGRIARGSLYEARHWLRRAFKRKLLGNDQVEKIKPIMDNLCPMLNAYLKSIGRPPRDQPDNP